MANFDTTIDLDSADKIVVSYDNNEEYDPDYPISLGIIQGHDESVMMVNMKKDTAKKLIKILGVYLDE